jgi:hypothetical protein
VKLGKPAHKIKVMFAQGTNVIKASQEEIVAQVKSSSIFEGMHDVPPFTRILKTRKVPQKSRKSAASRVFGPISSRKPSVP